MALWLVSKGVCAETVVAVVVVVMAVATRLCTFLPSGRRHVFGNRKARGPRKTAGALIGVRPLLAVATDADAEPPANKPSVPINSNVPPATLALIAMRVASLLTN